MLPRLCRISALLALITPALALQGQAKTPEERLSVARALYYTPTTRGLQSFSCQATMPWKAMLSTIGGIEVKDDNAALVYLNTVHLSVSDTLKGTGKLEWASTTVPKPELEKSVAQMKEGFQQVVSGFFQTWNGYFNGTMVPDPGKDVTVTATADGLHIREDAGGLVSDETIDKDMLLTRVQAVSTELKVVAVPTFKRTEEGLIVTKIASTVNQPVTAAPMQVAMSIEYRTVDAFQIPSKLNVDIFNVGNIEFAFHDCRVSKANADGLDLINAAGKLRLSQ